MHIDRYKPNHLRLLFAALACAILMTACGLYSTPSPAPSPSPAPVGNTQTPPGENGTLRVFLPPASGKVHDKTLQFINRHVMELGFDLEFACFRTGERDYNAAYAEYIGQYIGDNAVYITDKPYADALLADEVLADFADLARQYAPGYAANLAVGRYNDPGTLFLLPMSLTNPHPSDLCVLLREDIADEYGREIRTASDYLALLQWLGARDPAVTPGAIYCDTASLNIPMDLFLPEAGYWCAKDQEPYYVERSSNTVAPVYLMEPCKAAWMEFTRWQRDGLVFMFTVGFGLNMMGATLEDYPTILMYTHILADYESKTRREFYSIKTHSAFDAGGYRMYVLYPQEQPAVAWEYGTAAFQAVAGKYADLTEFFRLLSWLEYEDNYRRLFYGEESADYTMKNGRISYLEGETDWPDVRLALIPFQNNEFTPVSQYMPSNYEAELAAITRPYTFNLPLTDEKALRSARGGDDEASAIRASYQELLSSLINPAPAFTTEAIMDLVIPPRPDEPQARALIDEFVQRLSVSGHATTLNTQAMQLQDALARAAAH